jgi:RNA polymerase sigma-70 factor, ECF subfamily
VSPDQRFDEFYKDRFGMVFATVYLLTSDPATAEDATQEAFLRAFERWRRLADEPWAAGWVTTTAMNVAKRRLRRRRPVEPVGPSAPEPEALMDLWRAVRTLPMRQRQAVILRYRLDMTVEDAAAAMGCGPSTVRAYLSRAVEALRDVVGDEDDAKRREAPLAP